MVHVRRVTLIAAISLATGLLSAGGSAPNVTARAIVVVQEDHALSEVAQRLEDLGYDIRREVAELHALEVTGAAPDAHSLARRVAAVEGVRFAEPAARVVAAETPRDEYYRRQQAYLSLINAPSAWDIEQGAPDVIVAVIDTGVDVDHPDLGANIWTNTREVAANGVDDDANGCIDDVNGCAFVSLSSPGCESFTGGRVEDDVGHGTFVAGVIAARANRIGSVGVAPRVRILPVKVLDCDGAGDTLGTAAGILYAARMGARVINMSLGGYQDSILVREAIAQAQQQYGALSVAASGNQGTPGVAFPARVPEVLAVGATASDGQRRAYFSSHGPEVDVVAVGEGIVGPIPEDACDAIIDCFGNDPYGAAGGTSFAAPQASGLAALLLSTNRQLTPQQLTDIIKGSATRLSQVEAPGWAGYGRIDMLAALNAARSNTPPGDPCVIQSVEDGESFTCTGGQRVRMLQMEAPNPGECGGQWAFDALRNIFLTPGRAVSLQYDQTRTDSFGRTLAVPIWRGNDGADYNLSIVMVYVGLALWADVGAQNVLHRDWAIASQNWAAAAGWNMWAPGQTFNGGC